MCTCVCVCGWVGEGRGREGRGRMCRQRKQRGGGGQEALALCMLRWQHVSVPPRPSHLVPPHLPAPAWLKQLGQLGCCGGAHRRASQQVQHHQAEQGASQLLVVLIPHARARPLPACPGPLHKPPPSSLLAPATIPRIDAAAWAVQDYDSEGQYIRTWVPELACVPARRIHEPWLMSREEQAAAGVQIGVDYPAPLKSAWKGGWVRPARSGWV